MEQTSSQPSVAASARQFNLALVIQFGSSIDVNRIEHPESDIDLAYLVRPQVLTLKQEIDLQYQFAKHFEVFEDKIDLVNLAKASSLMLHQVATKGTVLYDRDGHQFNRFYIAAIKRFIDEQDIFDLTQVMLAKKLGIDLTV